MRTSTRIAIGAAILVLATLLLSTGAQAITPADCADPTARLELKTQAEVDSFPCTTVAGDLDINPTPAPNSISSLAPLTGLTRVEGRLNLVFNNTRSPSSLNGLDNLTHVGALTIKARISLSQPEQLKDISALAGLSSIGPRNCQPATNPAVCFTDLSISSNELTQLPAWSIASDPNLQYLTLAGILPLADPTQLDSLPIPSVDLAMSGGFTLDTSQPGQLATLARLASQARRIDLSRLSNLAVLPAMPNAEVLNITGAALPDLSAISAVNFPVLDTITLDGLAGITPDELAPIRDINTVSLQRMSGLSGANPLSGLTGGKFRTLFLVQLTNVTTLTDLLSVTDLDNLSILDMDGLTDLDGLQNLTSIARALTIDKNDNLQNVDALASLTSIGLTLEIQENPALTDLNGLRGVSGVLSSSVLVWINAQLTDISGLAGITGVGGGGGREEIFLFQNAVTECDVLVQSRLNPVPTGQDYFVDPPCVYAAPTLTSSATALDFGSAPIGSTVDRSVTFQNGTGSISTTVDISAVSISGDTLGEYSVLSEDCTPGQAQNPLTGGSTRNSCTVTVRFTVTQQGVDNAQLDIAYTTSESSTPMSFPVTLHAAGTGVTGDQLIPNTNLDFGQVELGASKTDTITIDNTSGSGSLTVTALKVKGGDFKLGDNSCGNSYPQTVPVGSQCIVTLRFTPSALGARASLFTMDSDGATSPDSVNLLGVGVEPPAPVANPTSLNFGGVPVGTTSTVQTVTVRNQGALRSLPLGQLSASGDFALQSDTCSGASLAPAGQSGDSCTVAVVYAPTTTGAATGTLSIPGASGYPSTSVPLTGNGLQPASLTASPNPLAFGTQTGPTTLAVTVTNIGAAGQDAQLGTASVTGTITPQQFGIDSDTCSGTTLAGQATCQITVTFDPFQEGADTGTLEIPYNSGQVLSVALSGRGGDPVDYVTPASLSFGNVEIGSSSAPQTVTVTDNSGIALDITSVSVSQGPGFSVQNDTCTGVTVNPGDSCTVEVVFTALNQGPAVGVLDIRSNSASSPDQVTLDGNGVTAPQPSLSPASIDFGPVSPGDSKTETVTVTNFGDEDLVIGTLSLGPSPDFSISADGCSGTRLAKGASCTFTVGYAPSTTGPVTSTVTLPSNAASSPTILKLAGGGVAPIPTAIPTLSDWARLTLLALIALIGIAAIRRWSGGYGRR